MTTDNYDPLSLMADYAGLCMSSFGASDTMQAKGNRKAIIADYVDHNVDKQRDLGEVIVDEWDVGRP